MDYENIYDQEVKLFNLIVEQYNVLQESDIESAYKLMRDSLQSYNRWSKIKYDIKKCSGRGEATAIKNRLEEICRYLKEVHITSRMIWSRGKDDLRANKEC